MAKKIAVLTSGGDSPGMNAAVRAVIRKALYHGLKVVGIYRGYQGLLKGHLMELDSRDASNIIQKGGTFLRTSRSKEFATDDGKRKAAEVLQEHQIDGLVVIGGDGSYTGALGLMKFYKGQIVGVPGTIDNDLYGTDETIGFDTAINTALRAIDNIRDTADAHDRFFVVEVMGRHAGFIAMDVGLGGGAEEVLLPETETDLKVIAERFKKARLAGKMSSIMVVAEGKEEGGAKEVAEKLKALSNWDYHLVVLGHIQRGGSPTARDRKLATVLGSYAVDCFLQGKTGVAVGLVNNELVATPFEEAIRKKKPIDAYTASLIEVMAH